MIEDIKTRLAARQLELSTKIREYEDSLLANRTQLNSQVNRLEMLKINIEAQQRPDFDALISSQQAKVASLEAAITELLNKTTQAESLLETLNAQLLELNAEKTKVSNEELTAYNTAHNNFNSEKVRLEVEINSFNKEISKLKAIKDTCPTCGQHLPHVHKPDTGELELTLASKQAELKTIKENIQKCNKQHQEYQVQINNAFKDELDATTRAISDLRLSQQGVKTDYQQCLSELEREKAAYTKLVYDQQNWSNFIRKQQEEISMLEAEIARLTNLISVTSLAKEDYDQRISVIKKMDQLTKRDFRGYLLANIISYLDQKTKKYCEVVFGTRELSLEINGNALDITYCGKAFDGLSGGEKQRVDLIIQLAIRDLLNLYLNLSANILVLDEITDFLDKKSCKAVMQLLEKELNTVESVFIISHHGESLEIPVDSEIRVIKNENGISELY
jgi:DNA repair exonuclease SbcCD ATPase subunit